MMIRSANPALSGKILGNHAQATTHEQMTISGVINKSLILWALLVASAAYVWHLAPSVDPAVVPDGTSGMFTALWVVGGIAGFIIGLITCFKCQWSPVTAPLYAMAEGFFLGGISAMLEAVFPGIVINAVGLTFGTLFAMLMAYRAGVIRATEKFKAVVTCATGGIAIVYLATFVLGMFGVGVPYIHEGGIIGIGFSLFVIAIAALNLIMDFDLIEQGARSQMPRYMEWYCGFSLMLTMIWLYIEFLHLLAKLRSE